MISETVLNTLQARMRRLLDASAVYAARDAELRADVERARLTDPSETTPEAASIRESKRLMDEQKHLDDHISGLIRSGQDPILVSDLNEELLELESRRAEIDQQIEQLRSYHQQALENAIRELEFAEREHRRITDQAMRLREHIEKISLG